MPGSLCARARVCCGAESGHSRRGAIGPRRRQLWPGLAIIGPSRAASMRRLSSPATGRLGAINLKESDGPRGRRDLPGPGLVRAPAPAAAIAAGVARLNRCHHDSSLDCYAVTRTRVRVPGRGTLGFNVQVQWPDGPGLGRGRAAAPGPPTSHCRHGGPRSGWPGPGRILYSVEDNTGNITSHKLRLREQCQPEEVGPGARRRRPGARLSFAGARARVAALRIRVELRAESDHGHCDGSRLSRPGLGPGQPQAESPGPGTLTPARRKPLRLTEGAQADPPAPVAIRNAAGSAIVGLGLGLTGRQAQPDSKANQEFQPNSERENNSQECLIPMRRSEEL